MLVGCCCMSALLWYLLLCWESATLCAAAMLKLDGGAHVSTKQVSFVQSSQQQCCATPRTCANAGTTLLHPKMHISHTQRFLLPLLFAPLLLLLCCWPHRPVLQPDPQP
jgi:hypothetical protein